MLRLSACLRRSKRYSAAELQDSFSFSSFRGDKLWFPVGHHPHRVTLERSGATSYFLGRGTGTFHSKLYNLAAPTFLTLAVCDSFKEKLLASSTYCKAKPNIRPKQSDELSGRLLTPGAAHKTDGGRRATEKVAGDRMWTPTEP